jgi:hypothetical protein
VNALVRLPASGGGVERALETCDAKFVTPFDARLWDSPVYREIVEWGGRAAREPASADTHVRKHAARILALGQTVGEIGHQLGQVTEALGATPDPIASRAMIGVLVDCFPNARPPNLEVYCSALLHDALSEGYSPFELARACRTIRRRSTFAPAIVELLAACAEAREHLVARKKGLERVRDILVLAAAMAENGAGSSGPGVRP